MPEGVQAFSVTMAMAPCNNGCLHCWAEGSPSHGLMPLERVYAVLAHLAQVRRELPGAFFLLDEPSLHPGLADVLAKASEQGLIWEGFFLPTNGSGLSRASDQVWDRLSSSGLGCLQLTLYGLEHTHDSFARRRGAFAEVITTIRRAKEHHIDWYAGVVLHQGNLGELDEVLRFLDALGADSGARTGYYPFSWQGRGRNAPRVREAEFARLVRGLRHASLVTESQGVRQILSTASLAGRQAGQSLCGALVFHVDQDLRVHCGGACDSGGILGAVPGLSRALLLGTLGDQGFKPLIDRYLQEPPWPIQRLREMTWGQLAERYGDRENDELYHLADLAEHKWAAAYLLDQYDADA